MIKRLIVKGLEIFYDIYIVKTLPEGSVFVLPVFILQLLLIDGLGRKHEIDLLQSGFSYVASKIMAIIVSSGIKRGLFCPYLRTMYKNEQDSFLYLSEENSVWAPCTYCV